MRNKVILFFIFLVVAIAVREVFAQTTDIKFPIPELGGCNNKTECKTFCDKEENIIACTDFAQKHNLISDDQAERTIKISQVQTGPGGCQDRQACEAT